MQQLLPFIDFPTPGCFKIRKAYIEQFLLDGMYWMLCQLSVFVKEVSGEVCSTLLPGYYAGVQLLLLKHCL